MEVMFVRSGSRKLSLVLRLSPSFLDVGPLGFGGTPFLGEILLLRAHARLERLVDPIPELLTGYRVREVDVAPLLVGLFRDAIESRLVALVESMDLPEGIPSAERPEKVAALNRSSQIGNRRGTACYGARR
jgi:hypothetical protein